MTVGDVREEHKREGKKKGKEKRQRGQKVTEEKK